MEILRMAAILSVVRIHVIKGTGDKRSKIVGKSQKIDLICLVCSRFQIWTFDAQMEAFNKPGPIWN